MKSKPMENDAIDSHRSTESIAAKSPISSTESAEAQIPSITRHGVVADTMDATANAITKDQSGLSPGEMEGLATIRRNLERGFLPMLTEFDFLLEMLRKLGG